MKIDTTFLRRCLASLERAWEGIGHLEPNDLTYEIFRAACVKEFELVLEQTGKLLRKRLAEYYSSNLHADRLTFKDLFRHANRHDLIDADAVERWLGYRDHRNDTAHDYGEDYAETTLVLLTKFIEDAKSMVDILDENCDG